MPDETGRYYFGPRPWGPAVDEPARMMGDAPVGVPCSHCDEPIADGDYGEVSWHIAQFTPPVASLRPQHRECILRHVLGSVGHQRGLCGCAGPLPPGVEPFDDPPGMTKREAARAAVLWYETHRLQ